MRSTIECTVEVSGVYLHAAVGNVHVRVLSVSDRPENRDMQMPEEAGIMVPIQAAYHLCNLQLEGR